MLTGDSNMSNLSQVRGLNKLERLDLISQPIKCSLGS